jgi:hypothetical protein
MLRGSIELTLQWLILCILLSGGHETGHLILERILVLVISKGRNINLSELDLLSAKGSKTEVGDLELGSWCRHD